MTDDLSAAVAALTVTQTRLNMDVDPPYAPQEITQAPLLTLLEDAIRGTLGRDASSKVASAFERNILDGEALFEFMKISSAIGSWCRMVGVRPTKVAADDLKAWHAAVVSPALFHVEQLQEWERIILGKLDPVKTVEITDPCPVCESSAWRDEEGTWSPRPVVFQYRRSDPFGTAGAWCRVEGCGAVWEDEMAVRMLSAQIGDDPVVLLAFLRN